MIYRNPGEARVLRDLQDMYDSKARKAGTVQASVAGDTRRPLISGLTATPDPADYTVTIAFTLSLKYGTTSLALLRNTTDDPKTAKVLQTYDGSALADGSTFSFKDADGEIARGTAYYWVAAHYGVDTPAYFGSVSNLPHNQTTAPPDAFTDFSCSLEATSGEVQQVSIAFPTNNSPSFYGVRVYTKNYQGSTDWVLQADSGFGPFQFPLLPTGETIQLKLIAVDMSGASESPDSPIKTLTLNGAATAPNKVYRIWTTSLDSGVQIDFDGGAELNITGYGVYRGPKGAGFTGASNIATVAPSTNKHFTYLDTSGPSGVYEWYITAINATGSTASDAITLEMVNTSAQLPPNTPSNYTNYATVDSIDAGTSATIRVYGLGGVSSSWTRETGYGSETYPARTFAGKAYATFYYVLYDAEAKDYIITTSYPATLPDSYIIVGGLTTVSTGGTGGTLGGGGGTGSGGGGRGGVLLEAPSAY